MIFTIVPGTAIYPSVVSVRCPACQHSGTFEPIADAHGQNFAMDVGTMLNGQPAWLGQRRCPNPDCGAHIFLAMQGRKILVSYPPQRIDFNATDVPDPIVKALEEAITCHANGCFVAAAIMVRKTLEELCRDRKAEGSSLPARIRQLRDRVVLPEELLQGLDDLRLLGNDAAHIESQEYDKIGQEEVEVAIELAKEVLKAVYQYATLVKRLRTLKKPPSS